MSVKNEVLVSANHSERNSHLTGAMMAVAKPELIAKKIETATNIAIIVAVFLISFILVKSYWLKPATGLHPTIAKGQKLNLDSLNWTPQKSTLVLALSTNCHFCTESAPFYRRVAVASQKQGLPLVAVFPQPVQEARNYLSHQGLSFNEVLQAPLSNIQVGGTPTLLLIDQTGVVQRVWIGKLSAEQEKEALGIIAP
jgi:peroxiredoxin